jgi:hypothetical protein
MSIKTNQDSLEVAEKFHRQNRPMKHKKHNTWCFHCWVYIGWCLMMACSKNSPTKSESCTDYMGTWIWIETFPFGSLQVLTVAALLLPDKMCKVA